MKVNSLENTDISFNGFYNGKALKKTLAFAEKNGALFMSATSLAFSAIVRPLSILSAPKTDNENKKIACAKALTSTILDFGITLAISLPVVRGIKKITGNPEKYLKSETIKNFCSDGVLLKNSDAFEFTGQLFKLGIGLIIAVPKALLNLAGLPYVLKVITKNDERKSYVNPSFRGKVGGESRGISDFIGKIMDSKKLQEFSVKNKDINLPMHIAALKDALTTGVFAIGAYNTKKINDKRKGALIYNSLISTGLSIAAAYCVDGLTRQLGEKFLNKLGEANKADPELMRYKQGFKIAKPAIIMSIIYYAIIPLISTFMAERLDKKLPVKR